MTSPQATEPADPLAAVKVGDPVPDECRIAIAGSPTGCGAMSQYFCTRNQGHPGQHIATEGRSVLEVWA